MYSVCGRNLELLYSMWNLWHDQLYHHLCLILKSVWQKFYQRNFANDYRVRARLDLSTWRYASVRSQFSHITHNFMCHINFWKIILNERSSLIYICTDWLTVSKHAFVRKYWKVWMWAELCTKTFTVICAIFLSYIYILLAMWLATHKYLVHKWSIAH